VAIQRTALWVNAVALAVMAVGMIGLGLPSLFFMGVPYALILAALWQPRSHSFVRMVFIVNGITLVIGLIVFAGTLVDRRSFLGTSGNELALVAVAAYGLLLPAFNLRISWALLKVAPHARPE
jgi:hypothetical protein